MYAIYKTAFPIEIANWGTYGVISYRKRLSSYTIAQDRKPLKFKNSSEAIAALKSGAIENKFGRDVADRLVLKVLQGTKDGNLSTETEQDELAAFVSRWALPKTDTSILHDGLLWRDMSVDLYRQLIAHGISENSLDSDGNTPLHCLVQQAWWSNNSTKSIRESQTDVLAKVRVLAEFGANTSIMNAKGESPVQQAVLLRNFVCAAAMLNAKELAALLGSDERIQTITLTPSGRSHQHRFDFFKEALLDEFKLRFPKFTRSEKNQFRNVDHEAVRLLVGADTIIHGVESVSEIVPRQRNRITASL